MSEPRPARDVIAGVLEPLLRAGWASPLAIADALIAAGVTMPEERAMQMVCAAMNSGRTDAEKLSRIEVVVAAWVDRPESLTPTATIEGLARGARYALRRQAEA